MREYRRQGLRYNRAWGGLWPCLRAVGCAGAVRGVGATWEGLGDSVASAVSSWNKKGFAVVNRCSRSMVRFPVLWFEVLGSGFVALVKSTPKIDKINLIFHKIYPLQRVVVKARGHVYAHILRVRR